MHHDFEACYRAISSRDARFDGRFFTAVVTTGVYCRPVCPAQTPLAANVRFYPSAAAAEAAGFRACLRCRPHLAPGLRGADPVAQRALTLISAGAADGPGGVAAVAARVGVSARHLQRLLNDAVGAGPLALARMRRLQTARILLEQTAMPITEVALGAGFGSLRQFNEAVRAGTGRTPTELRRHRPAQLPATGAVVLRLSARAPFDSAGLFRFFARRAIPGVEVVGGTSLARSLRLTHGPAVVELRVEGTTVRARIWLDDTRDLAAAVERCRGLLDLDAEPLAIDSVLERDQLLRPLLRRHPGLRIPGTADPSELAVRAVLGQQVSLTRATALAVQLTGLCGATLEQPHAGVTRIFPAPEALLEADLSAVGLTRERADTVRRVAAAVAAEPVLFEPGSDLALARGRLLALRGIGEWTSEYVALRGLRDPDAFPAGDLALRRSFAALGGGDAAALRVRAVAWRPWRAYATLHLWAHDTAPSTLTENAA